MTRSQQILALLDEYARRRRAAQQEQQQRIRLAAERDPMIAQLQERIAGRFPRQARLILADPGRSAAIAGQLKEDTLKDLAAITGRLAGLGLPPDYLDIRYTCDKCQDTGYIGEERARFCPCFEAELARAQWGSRVREAHSFEAFDPAIFPGEAQRQRTERARALCERYAQEFPSGSHPFLLLTGNTGLGKTFLLDAIANRVQQRGHPALRLTAFQMLSGMRAFHLSETVEDASLSQMISCPLLLIDDLGTEPMLRNITVEYLFLLLSERAGRHTVIATNLSLPQIGERYGERIVSRLVDTVSSQVIGLTGEDLRIRRCT